MRSVWILLFFMGCAAGEPEKAPPAVVAPTIEVVSEESKAPEETKVAKAYLPVSIDEVRERLSAKQTGGRAVEGGFVWKFGGSISSVEVDGEDATHLDRILLTSSAGAKLDAMFLTLDYAKIFAMQPSVRLKNWLESDMTLPASTEMDGMKLQLSLINSIYVLQVTPSELTH